MRAEQGQVRSHPVELLGAPAADPEPGDHFVEHEQGAMGVSQLAQEGYNRNTLKVGQEITAVVNPAANGAPTAIVVKVILADGSEIMSRERGQNPVD